MEPYLSTNCALTSCHRIRRSKVEILMRKLQELPTHGTKRAAPEAKESSNKRPRLAAPEMPSSVVRAQNATMIQCDPCGKWMKHENFDYHRTDGCIHRVCDILFCADESYMSSLGTATNHRRTFAASRGRTSTSTTPEFRTAPPFARATTRTTSSALTAIRFSSSTSVLPATASFSFAATCSTSSCKL